MLNTHSQSKGPQSLTMTTSYRMPVAFNMKPVKDDFEDSETNLPSKQLLLSIVRMGAMSSVPKTTITDHQDDDLFFPQSNMMHLLKRCHDELRDLPKPLQRNFRREMKGGSNKTIRIFQWNHLSQTLGTKNDNFVRCNPQALDWSSRRWRLLEEIIQYDPDIICMQEVDHFKLLQ